jgi:hypothetical protein
MSKTFEAVRHAIVHHRIQVSQHAVREAAADELLLEDLLAGTLVGEAIEDYPTDPRGPSCLVCSSVEGVWVHTVWGCDPVTRTAVLITAYRPNLAKWENDFKTRRR